MVAGHVIQKVMHVFYTMHGSPPPASVIPLQISASHWATIIYVIIGLLLRASYTDRSSYRLRLPISQCSNPKTIAIIFHLFISHTRKSSKNCQASGRIHGISIRCSYWLSQWGWTLRQAMHHALLQSSYRHIYCEEALGVMTVRRPARR